MATMHNDSDIQASRHANAGFRSILRSHRLRDIRNAPDGGYLVDSESGNTYTVRRDLNPNVDGALFVWACDCPARVRCRHIRAVETIDHAEALMAARNGDRYGLEIVERTW